MTVDGPKRDAYRRKSTHRRGEAAYTGVVRAFSVVLMALGIVILVSTLVNGGGPLSVGVLMGVAFLAVGAGRLWVSARMSR
jgi:hypothetical protein